MSQSTSSIQVDASGGLGISPTVLTRAHWTGVLYAVPLEPSSLRWLRARHNGDISGAFVLLDLPFGKIPNRVGLGGGFNCIAEIEGTLKSPASPYNWNRAILLTDREESLTLPQIRYLAARIARLSPAETAQQGSLSLEGAADIGEFYRAEVEEYLAYARPLLQLLGSPLSQEK